MKCPLFYFKQNISQVIRHSAILCLLVVFVFSASQAFAHSEHDCHTHDDRDHHHCHKEKDQKIENLALLTVAVVIVTYALHYEEEANFEEIDSEQGRFDVLLDNNKMFLRYKF